MKEIIARILNNELGEQSVSISEIVGFGSVNNVFDVSGQSNNYIVRYNKDKNKDLEFLKEEWCINNVRELDVFVAKVLVNGIFDGFPFMIQEKIEGINGSNCNKQERVKIWKFLGECASKYCDIEAIEIPALTAAEFHDNWESKLQYNINQLSPKDSLLSDNIFSIEEHKEIKQGLISMKNKTYKVGLIHGDLSPRNVIVNDTSICLIDWGTAAIDIVPYNEIGIVLMEGEADEEEFKAFLEGMGISKEQYNEMELEIRKSNMLHQLDKYRWAMDYDVENINNYTTRLTETYKIMMELESN